MGPSFLHLTEKEGFEPSRRFSRPTPFPGEPLRPAWVLLQGRNYKHRTHCVPRVKVARPFNSPSARGSRCSKSSVCLADISLQLRRGWDSNPCAREGKRFSRPPRYDHFDTSPRMIFAQKNCALIVSAISILANLQYSVNHFFT